MKSNEHYFVITESKEKKRILLIQLENQECDLEKF